MKITLTVLPRETKQRGFPLTTQVKTGPVFGEQATIARAPGNDPLIILADEPTGNLDSANGADILAILDRLHREGKTLIVVTHDEPIAVKAERVIQLFDGQSQEKSDTSLRKCPDYLKRKET